jgi:radical SAM protein with 4Fe4S-binding SPASM domain
MKKFKKIYIEITNICNLSCSFCSIDSRKKEEITIDKMEEILKKVNDYTDYIYLHVKGEPLLHKDLDKILDLCDKYHKKVNITTNGTLLKEKEKILLNPIVRQINISLHSENKKENYLDEIFETVDNLKDKIIVYRFWTMENNNLNDKSTEIVDKIIKYYQLSTETVEKIKNDKHIKIRDNLYIDKANFFIWPNVNNNYFNESGYCYALKDQLAILVDGTVVPCCLDSGGIVSLGNIYKQSLEEIINSKHYQEMKQGFCNRKVTEELCKHCSFKERLIKNH